MTNGETEVVSVLQQQIANAFLLYMNYKHYHWQSYGPLFRDLHLLFDEQGNAALGTIDELGERVRMLRGVPLWDPRQFIERGTVTIAEPNQTMRDMLAEVHKNTDTIIDELKAGIEVASHAKDPGTADLLTRIVQIYEKHEWFLRETLERGDSMVEN